MVEKKVNYFSHDYNARNDPKMLRLRKEMSVEGVGIYWSLIEILYEQGGFILEKDVDAYADSLSVEPKKVRKVLENFELFLKKGKKYVSKSAEKRLKAMKEKSDKARKSVAKRWNNRDIKENEKSNENDTNVLQTQCESNTINKGKEIKEINKERKEGKEKEKEGKTDLPPAAADFKKIPVRPAAATEKISESQPAEFEISSVERFKKKFRESPVNKKYLIYDLDFYFDTVFRKFPDSFRSDCYSRTENLVIKFIEADINDERYSPRFAPKPQAKKITCDEFCVGFLKKHRDELKKIFEKNPEVNSFEAINILEKNILESGNEDSKELQTAINRYQKFMLELALERLLNSV